MNCLDYIDVSPIGVSLRVVRGYEAYRLTHWNPAYFFPLKSL